MAEYIFDGKLQNVALTKYASENEAARPVSVHATVPSQVRMVIGDETRVVNVAEYSRQFKEGSHMTPHVTPGLPPVPPPAAPPSAYGTDGPTGSPGNPGPPGPPGPVVFGANALPTQGYIQEVLAGIYSGIIARIDQFEYAQRKQQLEQTQVQDARDSAGPTEPGYQVYFDMGPLGVISGRYHSVDISDTGVLLAFDTRFRYAAQYMPPLSTVGAPPWKVTIVEEGTAQELGPIPCVSLGFCHRLGYNDIVVLVRSLDEQQVGAPLGG